MAFELQGRSTSPVIQQPTSTPNTDNLSSNWMALYAQQRQLNELILPGTHDSGCYERFSLDRNCFDDSRALRTVHKLGPLTRRAADRWARTQYVPVYGQLRMGVRFVDLRVAWDKLSNNYHIVHTFTGPPLSDVLNDIKRFLSECPQEVMMMLVVPKGNVKHEHLISYLVDFLDGNLHKNLHDGSFYRTVGEMVALSERVVLYYEHHEPFQPAAIPSGHRAVLWNASGLHDPFFNTDSQGDKCRLQQQELQKFVGSGAGLREDGDETDTEQSALLSKMQMRRSRLFQLAFTLTPQTKKVVADSVCCCVPLWHTLESLAKQMNSGLQDFLDTLDERELGAINLVTVDFAEEQTIRCIIELNKTR